MHGLERRAYSPLCSGAGDYDLMAQIAGMERIGRWAGWNHEPFTDYSTKHVTAWQKRQA